MKVKEILDLSDALAEASKCGLKGKANYGIAKNMKRIASIVQNFSEENNIIIESFGVKNDDGSFKIAKIINGSPIIDFGDNKDLADKAFEELVGKETDYQPYEIQLDDECNKIPTSALVNLLDVVIFEDLQALFESKKTVLAVNNGE